MSKFTKALEKVQQPDDDDPVQAAKKAENVFQAATAAPQPAPAAEQGAGVVQALAPDARVVVARYPNSLLAEQYRMLRTTLKSRLSKQTGNVILVSSAVQGEGKTVTAANLGLAFAENGDSTVALVDADLRRGRLAELLGFGRNLEGLSNFLANGLAVRQIMVRSRSENLVVIPRGALAEKPSELVGSSKFRRMIAELRNFYDYVVIDAPPILSAADASMLGREADGILLVIQVGKTPKSAIAHANFLFKQAGVQLLGYVLTRADYPTMHYYDGQEERTARTRSPKPRFSGIETTVNKWWESRQAAGDPATPDEAARPKRAETSAPAAADAATASEPGGFWGWLVLAGAVVLSFYILKPLFQAVFSELSSFPGHLAEVRSAVSGFAERAAEAWGRMKPLIDEGISWAVSAILQAAETTWQWAQKWAAEITHWIRSLRF